MGRPVPRVLIPFPARVPAIGVFGISPRHGLQCSPHERDFVPVRLQRSEVRIHGHLFRLHHTLRLLRCDLWPCRQEEEDHDYVCHVLPPRAQLFHRHLFAQSAHHSLPAGEESPGRGSPIARRQRE